MSIFGEERKIKFKKNGTDVLIDHCVILRSEPEPKTIMHESIINRHREWIDIYNHHIVECIAYLCKYADPNAAYQNFLQYEGALVDSLYEYIDGNPFFDENITPAKFWLEKIKPRYIETDEYPDELRFTFRSEKSVYTHKLPSDIPDLWLWFNDDTLENPSSNQFVWTDKVSGYIVLSGNFGTGDGLVDVFGKNVLHVLNVDNSENQLNHSFDLPAEMTMIGVSHFDFPNVYEGFQSHVLSQGDYPSIGGASTYAFNLQQYTYTLSGPNPLYWNGIVHEARTSFDLQYELGFQGNSPSAPSETQMPYIPTFFCWTFDTNSQLVNLILNSNSYGTSKLINISKPIVKFILNYRMKGRIYEFMFFNRKLTASEINDLKIYYKTKYNIQNDIGIS